MSAQQPRRYAGDSALVRDASDPEQVQRGERLEARRRRRELDDLRALIATPAGRRVLFRLLEHCKVFESIWDPSSRIHMHEGMRQVGLFLMAEIEAADDEALFTMMRESKDRARQDAIENAATRTPRAAERADTEESES